MQWSYLESFQDSPSQYLKKSFTIPTQQKTCKKGQKYNSSSDTCVPCEGGTYQDATNHTLEDCKPHKEHECDDGFYLDVNAYNTRKKNTKNSTVNLDGLCLEHPSLDVLRTKCSGYILEDKYNTKINDKKQSPLTTTDINDLCLDHPSLKDLRTQCSGYILDQDYNEKISDKKKESPLTTTDINNLCLEHPSLNNLRDQCSGYILETEYDTKINEKNKESTLTTNDINDLCLEHNTCGQDQYLHGVSKSSPGSCKECPEDKYQFKIQHSDDACINIPVYPLQRKNASGNKLDISHNVKIKVDGKYVGANWLFGNLIKKNAKWNLHIENGKVRLHTDVKNWTTTYTKYFLTDKFTSISPVFHNVIMKNNKIFLKRSPNVEIEPSCEKGKHLVGKICKWIPVDCTIGAWTGCTKKCDGGKQFRTIVQASHGGKECTSNLPTEQSCNTKPCPIDCKESKWGDCSKTCGRGTLERDPPTEAKNGGKECTAKEKLTSKICNDKRCDENYTKEPAGYHNGNKYDLGMIYKTWSDDAKLQNCKDLYNKKFPYNYSYEKYFPRKSAIPDAYNIEVRKDNRHYCQAVFLGQNDWDFNADRNRKPKWTSFVKN